MPLLTGDEAVRQAPVPSPEVIEILRGLLPDPRRSAEARVRAARELAS